MDKIDVGKKVKINIESQSGKPYVIGTVLDNNALGFCYRIKCEEQISERYSSGWPDPEVFVLRENLKELNPLSGDKK